jgi:release factor H-coupled RctB family protein
LLAAYSVAHGAGRAIPRAKARAKGQSSRAGFTLAQSLETTSLHSTVVCEERDLLFEEVPEAYKAIDSVVKDLEDAGIVEVVAVMRPVVTYKIRKGEE